MSIRIQLKITAYVDRVRALAAELKISALTVKKAYDLLEEEGYIATVHGKGSYVKDADPEMMAEQRYREIEEEMELIVEKARSYGMEEEQIVQLLNRFPAERKQSALPRPAKRVFRRIYGNRDGHFRRRAHQLF